MPIGYIIAIIAAPLLELALLIKAGQWLGFWPVFAIIMVSGIAGVLVLRLTGVTVLRRMMSGELARNPLPSMMDTSVLFFAGVLLILPGLIGDCLGLLLLIPPVRHFIIPRIWRATVASGTARFTYRTRRWTSGAFRRAPRPEGEPGSAASPTPPPGRGPIIDGEFERLGERTVDPKRPRSEG